MIILTGVSGFIGSCMLTYLNEHGFEREVVVVDDFYKLYKEKNFEGKSVREYMHRDIFLEWFEQTTQPIDFVIHLGARTDTTSQEIEIFDQLNLQYSKRIWNVCTARSIPLIYASSAATYGNGDKGFTDDETLLHTLLPLNPYAISKHQFDLWVKEQKSAPPFWAGFKFFNVYGPNEYHKGRMASVIFHTFNQIRNTGKMNLFRSHKSGIEDGHQKRDFIYVKDVISVLFESMQQHKDIPSGIYNLGTGNARTFLDLAVQTFKSFGKAPKIEFIDTPLDIRDSYQYFTQADMEKLRRSGLNLSFTSLEDGIDEYVSQYLISEKYY
jgi:ADP-L-glycero-D-manno-heptose 6-epimerase